jgi:hypothetical protein
MGTVVCLPTAENIGRFCGHAVDCFPSQFQCRAARSSPGEDLASFTTQCEFLIKITCSTLVNRLNVICLLPVYRCCVVIVFCSGYDCLPTHQLSKCHVTISYCRHAKRRLESWTEVWKESSSCTPALILGLFFARPFALTTFTNLHHLLICAITFSV